MDTRVEGRRKKGATAAMPKNIDLQENPSMVPSAQLDNNSNLEVHALMAPDEAPDETEVASPIPIPVEVVPKPDVDALNTSQRKEVEGIFKLARLVGVKTRVLDKEAIQILLSNIKEKVGNSEVGRGGGYNHWRNTSIFLKRGERGEPYIQAPGVC
ncbi:hypothetical protein QQ045_018370 [Rhodiola kirilowii]